MAVHGILGKKVGMTQLFDDKGDVRPATVIQAGPCVVTQRKNGEQGRLRCGTDRTGRVREGIEAEQALSSVTWPRTICRR